MASKGIIKRNIDRLNTAFRYEQAVADETRKKAEQAKEAKRREDAEIDRVICEILRIPLPDSVGNKHNPAS